MAVVYEDSLFGTDGAANMMSFLQDNGIEVSNLIAYSAARTEPGYFRSILAPLTVETPDIIHMISYIADGVSLVKTIRDLRIPAQLSGGAGGFTHPRFLREAGAAAEGLLVATLWSEALPYRGARTYYEGYQSTYELAPDYHGAEAYSALLVTADALRRAKSLQPADIRTALDETFMQTPFGPVKFYSYADFERQNSVRTQVLQVQSGQFEVLWPPELATSRFANSRTKP
jgi:branched-chain amino acid transport system substrate-binding protein